MEPSSARKMHRTLEPYHGMIYFVPEGPEEYGALGLDEGGAYFVVRSAALGVVPPEVVIATFYNFEPGFVRQSLSGVWEDRSPGEVIEARYRVADRALRRMLGDEIAGHSMALAAAQAREAAEGLDPSGRPLFAGHASLPWPEEPHLQLWHAVTLLREYRGDGHVAALANREVGPCEALVLHAGTGEVSAGILRATRRWSDDEWAEAVVGLTERGLLADDGALTAAGQTFRGAIEEDTDRLALAPWRPLGDDGCGQLRRAVRPFSRAIVSAATFAAATSARAAGGSR